MVPVGVRPLAPAQMFPRRLICPCLLSSTSTHARWSESHPASRPSLPSRCSPYHYTSVLEPVATHQPKLVGETVADGRHRCEPEDIANFRRHRVSDHHGHFCALESTLQTFKH